MYRILDILILHIIRKPYYFSLSWLQSLTLLPTGGVTANQNITLGGVAANQNTNLQDVQRTAPPPRPKSR